MKNSVLWLSFILFLLPALASANGPYIGASSGQSELDLSDVDSAMLESSGTSVDGEDTAYRVFMGYRYSENFAYEAFYADLGEATLATGGMSVDLESKTAGMSFLGLIPINNAFDIYAKAGLHYWNLVLAASDVSIELDEGIEVTYGVGLQYSIGQWLFRAEFERYEIGGADVDMGSVGIALYY